MTSHYCAPVPVPAGAETHHLRTQRWWRALTPVPMPEAVQLRGRRAAFTVRTGDREAVVWSTEHVFGDVALALDDGRLSVWAELTEGPEVERVHGPRRRFRRAVPVPVGVTVPVVALRDLHADVDDDGSWTVRLTFGVDSHRCEVIVDGNDPQPLPVIRSLAERLVVSRGVDSRPRLLHVGVDAHARLRLELPGAVPVAATATSG